jgi:GntR family transcriptional regulator
MFFPPNPASGVPAYRQLIEQVRHAIETGALRRGEQLPGTRRVAEDLVMNPNTVAKAYQELEHQGVIEMRKGLGAFVVWDGRNEGELIQKAQPAVRAVVDRMIEIGLSEGQMRRLFENEVTRVRRQRVEE